MTIRNSLTRFLGSKRLAVAGCALLLFPSHASAADGEVTSVNANSSTQRLPSTLETQAAPIRARLLERDKHSPTRSTPSKERSLWLGGGFAWIERTSNRPSLVTYQAGPSVEFSVNILLTPWLGARLSGGNEFHSVRVHSLSDLADLTTAADASLQGLSLAAAVEPRWEISERFSVLAGFGVAWDRFALGEMKIETVQGAAIVRPRTGVMIDYPITLGLGFALIPNRFAAVLRGRYAPHSYASGDLFNGGTGAGQTVSQSTGDMLFVPGLPRFAPALSLGLHFELAL